MKLPVNNTILNKIGISDAIVEKWLKNRLKISYPMLKNNKYYESEDGFAFVENGDKYVIPLTLKEITLYTKNPEIFKKYFLENVKFYISFINWLHKIQPKTQLLEAIDKFTSLLSILYLFQRAMDHHYFHFDRYLVYQNYPDTPVGFWWQIMKEICQIVARKEKTDPEILFLKLLTEDIQFLLQYKKILTTLEFDQLLKALKNIHIFEDAQEAEVELITDKTRKENILFHTAIPIWNDLMKLLKKYPELIKQEYKSKIPEIIEGHPLIVTRLILSPEGLNYFQSDIFEMFEEEIKRWI
ncbi:MAG: hypothetical protein Q7R95_02765 [bacterium]|nr:hypothetical protein [bacterium]